MPTLDYLDLELAPRGNYRNGSSVLDEGHLGIYNTYGVGSGLPTSQARGHGGGHPSRNSGTAVYRNIYGSATSSGATDYSFSSWRGFYFHRDYIFRGAHDYARAGQCYHYRYTGNADTCHGGGRERISATSAWSIRTSASPTTTTTTTRPR